MSEQVVVNSSPSKLSAYVLAARPSTLLASIAPVLVGSLLGVEGAWQGSHFLIFISALLCAMLMQAGANLVNDAKDFERGVDTHDRLGPLRAAQAGLLTVAEIKFAYRLLFGVALALALVLASQSGPLIFAIGVFSVFMAYLYTGGPLPLSHLGLGELTALLCFGPMAVAGTAYLQHPVWNWNATLWGLAPGFIAAAMMAINNFRDFESDKKAGKRTLAVRIGYRAASVLPMFCLWMSFTMIALYGFDKQQPIVGCAFFILAWTFARLKVHPLLRRGGASLNQALVWTSKSNLILAVAFLVLTIL